jgi:hypothetical protein
VNERPYDFLCITEHWLKNEEFDFFNIKGYRLVTSFSRIKAKHGGTAIYAAQHLAVKVIDISGLCSEVHCEASAICL